MCPSAATLLLICIVRKLYAGKSADEQVKNHSGFL